MPATDSLTKPDQLPRPAAGQPLWGVTILLVEDSRFAADGLRLMALRGGARLRRTETLAQARRHLSLYLPDVVLVDPGLPDGPGEELISELASAPRPPVVLAISGDPEREPACRAAGAAGFVAKPLAGCAEFFALIRSHLPQPRAAGHPLPVPGLPAADDLALREDLIFARSRLSASQSQADRTYLSGFLEGLARATADPVLAEAAGALVASDPGQTFDLSRLISQRIADLPQPFLRSAI
ncbi:response regulator [Falsigemmobacter faecalis]|uniref:Response regulator n=1 Tax=Falsigemmobacter faecalis TaxID=2488730 RepID=A0A3P3DKH9_9RHOB|nr:response regulator [Falsigemmobacter faecalis]RRH74236.1 response regulator [Falsigemmobacter faecalis]